MPTVLALISGYQGSGKTTLCTKLLASQISNISFKDVDDFDLSNLREELDRFIENSKLPVVLFGTFNDGVSSSTYFPTANRYIWLDVAQDVAIERAITRQLEAISQSTIGLTNFLLLKSPIEASHWLDEYLNPHTRQIEANRQLQLCSHFERMTEVDIIKLFVQGR